MVQEASFYSQGMNIVPWEEDSSVPAHCILKVKSLWGLKPHDTEPTLSLPFGCILMQPVEVGIAATNDWQGNQFRDPAKPAQRFVQD